MESKIQQKLGKGRNRPGLVLLITLVLLVVLATLGYILTSRTSAHRRRSQYLIDYQSARYGCDSAVKYALTMLESISPKLINRSDKPDFSDIFYLSEEQYQELLEQWGLEEAAKQKADFNSNRLTRAGSRISDINDTNDINDVNNMYGTGDFNDANSSIIPGPYGPDWPFVIRPSEFEIGSTKVKIEIEDENAKYPVGWMLMRDRKVEPEVLAGFESFCEWMDVNEMQIYSLEDDFKQLSEIKPFKIKFEPKKKRVHIKDLTPAQKEASARHRIVSRTRKRTRYKIVSISPQEQVTQQATDFAQLFHSALVDVDTLSRPTIVSESRKESLLKYMGMFGSAKVNINTAPRHVLEAAFAFGGDAVKIADEIIRLRRIKPLKDTKELEKELLRYSDSIRKCSDYITTTSKFFTIRVTAVSGLARASAIIAITKEGRKMRKIAIVSG